MLLSSRLEKPQMNKKNYITLPYHGIYMDDAARLHRDYFRELGICWQQVMLMRFAHNYILWKIECSDEQLSFLVLKYNASITTG